MDELRAAWAVPHPGRAAAPRDRVAGASAQLDRARPGSDRGTAACPRIAGDNRSSFADARANSLAHTKPDADSHAAPVDSHPDTVAAAYSGAAYSGADSSYPRAP